MVSTGLGSVVPEASLACIEILAEKESQHAQKALDEVPHWRDDRLTIKQLLAPYLGYEQELCRKDHSADRGEVFTSS